METLIGVLEGPRVTGCVLLHLQRGGGHTTGVGSLARREGDLLLQEVVNRLRSARHIRTLGDVTHLVVHQQFSVITIEFVLGSTRQRNIGLNLPDITALVELHALAGFPRIGGDTLTTHFLNVLEQLQVHTIRGGDVAGGIRHSHNRSAKLLNLLRSVNGHVARTGHDNLGAVEGFAMSLHHLCGEVDQTVAGSLSAHERATPGQAFTRQDAGLVLILQAAILTKEVANFAATNANVTCRNIAVLADVIVQFRHEGLAEAHDLSV